MNPWRTVIIWSLANAIQFYSSADFATLQKSYSELLTLQVPDFQSFYSLVYSYVLMLSIPLSTLFSYLCTRYGVFKPMIALYMMTNLAQVNFPFFFNKNSSSTSKQFASAILISCSALESLITQPLSKTSS